MIKTQHLRHSCLFFTFSWSTKEDDLSRGLTALQGSLDAYGCSQAADGNQVVAATLSQTVICLLLVFYSIVFYNLPGKTIIFCTDTNSSTGSITVFSSKGSVHTIGVACHFESLFFEIFCEDIMSMNFFHSCLHIFMQLW